MSNGDQLAGAAQQFPVSNLIYPVTALAGAEAKFTLPRGREQQATPVETPAAEHTPHLQALDGTQSVLGVDADLVLGLAHKSQVTAEWDD